jgi:hypothetical protein
MLSTKVMMLGHPMHGGRVCDFWGFCWGGGPKELGNHLALSSLIYNYKRVALLLVSSKPRDRPSDIMFGFLFWILWFLVCSHQVLIKFS